MTRQRLLQWGLVAVILLTPLIVGKTLLYPFVVYRTYFFSILVDLLFVVFLLEYGLRWAEPLWKNMVGRAAIIFIGAKLLTDMFGLFPWVSFWGNYERMMGFVTHLHLALFFVMAATVFRAQYAKLIDGVAYVSGIVALYGMLQPQTLDERIFSTIGNPAFLAGFLLFGVFFGAWRAWEESVPWRRYLLALSSFVSLIAIYMTATRGAILGLAVGAGVGAAWLAWRKKSMRVPVFVFLCAGVLAFFALRAFQDAPFVREKTTLRRLASISFTDFTVQSRVAAWKMAASGIRERPLLGVGEGNIVHPLDRHMRQELLETWFDSSHNAFLDILLAHGILGFAAYLFLFFSVFRALRAMQSVGMLAALIAYLVQAFFILDTLVVLLPLWLLFGWAAAQEIAPVSDNRRRMHTIAWAAIAVVGILLLSYLRPIRALAALSDKQFDTALALATFGYGNIASIIRDDILRNPQLFASLRPVLDRAYMLAREKEGELSPYYSDLAQVYLAAPRLLRLPLLPDAEQLLNRALAISPGRVDVYFAKAQALYDAGNIDGSVALLREIQALFPAHVSRAEGVLEQIDARR